MGRGLTIIEVIVNIAIIVVMVAIVIPVARVWRSEALSDADIICQSNQKQLVNAWLMYAFDYDGRLINAHVVDRPDFKSDPAWVNPPHDAGGIYRGDDRPNLANKLRGLRSGLFSTYVEYKRYLDTYHCTADQRESGSEVPYRSYALAAGLNGKSSHVFKPLNHISFLHHPSKRYVYVEQSDRHGWNRGAWKIYPDASVHSWRSVPAIWHAGKSTLSFADGHVEMHKWRDKRTLEYALHPHADLIVQFNNEDIRYMQRGFACLNRVSLDSG